LWPIRTDAKSARQPPRLDHTERFVEIAAALSRRPARTLILDGEVCLFDEPLVALRRATSGIRRSVTEGRRARYADFMVFKVAERLLAQLGQSGQD